MTMFKDGGMMMMRMMFKEGMMMMMMMRMMFKEGMMMMMPLMFKEGMKMALMFGVSCVDPAAGPGGQRQCGPLRIGQAGREAGAGLRVPDEQGPASVGHHHQPPGQTPHARPRPGGPGLTGSFVFTFT